MAQPIELYDKDGNPVKVNADGSLVVSLGDSGIAVPTDIQSRYAQTIQTHNAVSVAQSGTSVQSTYIDCNGFDKIGVSLLNDAGTASSADIYWSNDGITTHGRETVIASAVPTQKIGITDIKARYAKLGVNNGDSALAHVMSAWVYLKA